jgi:rhodanese-related sulfurtransferase
LIRPDRQKRFETRGKRRLRVTNTNATVENVHRDELKKGLADGTILLVDVREPNEYAAGRIPGAILNPLQNFDPKALPRAPGKRVVLSCRSGRRSLAALALAQNAGRDDVRAHYPGGFQEWANAGEPVEV